MGMAKHHLFWAVRYNKPEVAKILLKNGAALDCRDGQGRTPLSYAAERNNDAMQRLLLEAEVWRYRGSGN
jgi:ankyrin repeat protein